MARHRLALLAGLLVACSTGGKAHAGAAGQYLYPDMFPYVDENAPSDMVGLQNWQLSGTRLSYTTLFANKGDGLFEIRRGPDLNADEYLLLQRVYIDNDFGSNYEDIPIGTAPIPGTAGSPNPSDTNVIWFEDFSHFSLHEAPVVDGVLTVGDEVAGERKTSWRLSSNRGPMPGYEGAPEYFSSDQSIEQRISVGHADLYGAGSSGQFFDITGVPVGPLYWLRQTVDPENRLMETDETNNTFEVLIDLANPGEVLKNAEGLFLRPGDNVLGDLNGDGAVDLDDWLQFQAGAETDLTGLSPSDAYALGDLDADGRHSLSDAVLFRQYYDFANGSGSFASATSAVPEPTTLVLFAAAGALALSSARTRVRRLMLLAFGLSAHALANGVNVARAQVVLFSEDFEGVSLGPNVDEGLFDNEAWTDTPPTGWTVDDSGVPWVNTPSIGVTEWEGWSFADKNWWSATAGDQGRSQFSLGSGTVAVADPDEWDDLNSPANTNFNGSYYNAWMTTPSIPIGLAAPGGATLTFASSWRDECCDDGFDTNNQTALIRASYDGGQSFAEVLRWESASGAFFKNDATNEQVTIPLNNPAGADTLVLEFGLVDAGNDWWWAVDNIQVVVDTSLEVDVATGEMKIVGAGEITGYEITSAAGSLDSAGWASGNLDAQNYDSLSPATADANNDGVVDAADYTALRNEGAAANELDAWINQYGTQVALGETWETLIADDDQLLEFRLTGASTFDEATIGPGYDTQLDARDLVFTYSNADGEELFGGVSYVNSSATAAVPEPGLALVACGLLIVSGRSARA